MTWISCASWHFFSPFFSAFVLCKSHWSSNLCNNILRVHMELMLLSCRARKWRSHNLHADKSVKGCTLITVRRWNTGAPPTLPTHHPLPDWLRLLIRCQRRQHRWPSQAEGAPAEWLRFRRPANDLARAQSRASARWSSNINPEDFKVMGGKRAANPLAASLLQTLPPLLQLLFSVVFHHLTEPRHSKSCSSTLASCVRKAFQSFGQCAGFPIPSASF